MPLQDQGHCHPGRMDSKPAEAPWQCLAVTSQEIRIIVTSGKDGGRQGGLTHRELCRWLKEPSVQRGKIDGQSARALLGLYN